MNLLVGGEEFVQRSGRSHLHDQHKTVCVAQAKHADDERVTQLVHDLCLPHHLLLHQLLVFVLQHLDGHVYLTPESKQNTGSDISRRTHGSASVFKMFGSSRFCFEDSLLDTAKVPRAELHLVHQQVGPLDVEPLDIIGVVIRVESIAVHGEKVAVFGHSSLCRTRSCKVQIAHNKLHVLCL